MSAAWADLADRLRSRYPDDWAERYKSYKDGTNRDVQRWRAIGGELYIPAPPTIKPKPAVRQGRPVGADPATVARNERVRAAARSGVCLADLSERFGMTPSAISKVLARFGERAAR